MASSLSNLVNNLSEGIDKIKCKYRNYDKKCTNLTDHLIGCKCLCRKKTYQQKFDETLKERFLNTCKFSTYDKNNFILLLLLDI